MSFSYHLNKNTDKKDLNASLKNLLFKSAPYRKEPIPFPQTISILRKNRFTNQNNSPDTLFQIYSLLLPLAVADINDNNERKKNLLDISQLIYNETNLEDAKKLKLLEKAVNMEGNSFREQVSLLTFPLRICAEKKLHDKALRALNTLIKTNLSLSGNNDFENCGRALFYAAWITSECDPDILNGRIGIIDKECFHAKYIFLATKEMEKLPSQKKSVDFYNDLKQVAGSLVAKWIKQGRRKDKSLLKLLENASKFQETSHCAIYSQIFKAISEGDMNKLYMLKMKNKNIFKELNVTENKCKEKIKYLNLVNFATNEKANDILSMAKISRKMMFDTEEAAEKFVLDAIDKGYIQGRIEKVKNCLVMDNNTNPANEETANEVIFEKLKEMKKLIKDALKKAGINQTKKEKQNEENPDPK